MKLSELKKTEKGIITKVRGRGAFRKRITEMGFVKNKEVTVVKGAPLKDPVEYQIMDYEVSLRNSEADLIDIIIKEEAEKITTSSFEGVLTENILKVSAKEKGRTINVALIGNPNSGKTTFFNHASKSKEHVGNYGGVTIDTKTAKFKQEGYDFNLTDLPGTYSLTAHSPEELFVRNHIIDNVPDVVINIVDASNLERNLYLTTQLIDMDIKVVIALNMHDELTSKGDKLDYEALGKMIGIPIIPTISTKAIGISDLFQKVIDVFEDKDPPGQHIHINYGSAIEQAVNTIQKKINIEENVSLTDKWSSRFIALKLLEKDKKMNKILEQCLNFHEIEKTAGQEIEKLEIQHEEDSETLITDGKYGFISGALKETYKLGPVARKKKSEVIDNFITHKLWGFPVFVFFMWLMFQSTFTLGAYPMDWIDSMVGAIASLVNNLMPDGMLKDLLVDGVIAGVGGVIIFLPNILILFFFISLMEDTGYISRAAFIMDKLMQQIGLNGKSFIPLVMGFGCNVPAIMSTRILESKNNRLLTMLINPFMSCSARLPVYILIIGAFFPNYPGTALFSIYFIGILLAIIIALFFKKTLLKLEDVPFVMELPPYRMPTLKSTLIHMWGKGSQYLKKMGGVILIASILIWAAGYFPRDFDISKDYDVLIAQTEASYNLKHGSVAVTEREALIAEKDAAIAQIAFNKEAERFERSFIGRLGHFIEPVLRPLGFDWKMGVSLITGMAAKEIVVSTMGVLYQANAASDNSSETLVDKLRSHTFKYGERKGEKVFTPLVAFGFMMFILIYFPCIAVIAAIKKETGGWKWAVFTMVYTTGLAYVVSLLVYQIGSLII
ncbi:MAG TPA: ferrous iron transport protein B [Flavobacteriales bacterium]|nr:ferrous iron transport protein B [Flavobacteriales bacterium]